MGAAEAEATAVAATAVGLLVAGSAVAVGSAADLAERLAEPSVVVQLGEACAAAADGGAACRAARSEEGV